MGFERERERVHHENVEVNKVKTRLLFFKTATVGLSVNCSFYRSSRYMVAVVLMLSFASEANKDGRIASFGTMSQLHQLQITAKHVASFLHWRILEVTE